MGHNKKDSAVDDRLMLHECRNLLALGSSSFTTVSPSNPTLTLSALSIRSADLLF